MASLDDNASRRAEELEALRSFYGDDVLDGPSEGDGSPVETATMDPASPPPATAASPDGPWRIRVGPRSVLELFLPPDYPSSGAPTPLLWAPPWVLDEGRAADLTAELVGMYAPDSEVAIMWAEHCRAALGGGDDGRGGEAGAEEEEKDGSKSAGGAGNRADSGDEPDGGVRTFVPPTSRYGQPVRHFDASVIADESNRRTIHRGAPYHPPKSGPSETMVAHVARVTSMDHVNWVLAELLFNDKKVAKATHNMIAYRFWDPDRGCLMSDNDDDGEKGAGTKLAALLEMSDARDAMVVVSRWFGGVLLGPSRFKHIASVARDALEEAGFIATPPCASGGGGDGAAGKRKGRKGRQG